jgi:twinkle protein
VLDPWNCIADEKPSHMAQTDWINKALFDLKLAAQEMDIHIAIVAHPTKMRPARADEPEPRPTLTDISGSINFRNQTDYGIVVYRDPGNYDRRHIVEISVNKLRYQETGQVGETAEFRFDPDTSCLHPLNYVREIP